MGEWGFLGGLFDTLQAYSPMLGRFWLLLMLVFRILILGTVASDLFNDEQEEFACNTLQPGCKQVCYDMAFPISQYRFWVFHIVIIALPSLLFLMYAMHQHKKQTLHSKSKPVFNQDYTEDLRFRRLYIVNVTFRLVAEIGFLAGQWLLYGFKVEAQFPCTRFPCPYTVDCFTSRPAEKTVFLCFYFIVGLVSTISSCAELLYAVVKWFCTGGKPEQPTYAPENPQNTKQEEAEEKPRGRTGSAPSRLKGGSLRSSGSTKVLGYGYKHRGGKYMSSRTHMV